MKAGGGVQRRCFLMTNGRSSRGRMDRFCGLTDPPLSGKGRQAVLDLRGRLQENGERLPKIWYVSDRRRAVETFEIMTAGMPAPVIRLTEALREIHFGHYENLTWEELPADFQRHYESCRSHPMELKFPGGEGFYELCERVSTGALEILSFDEDDADVGIVGHQGSLRVWHLMARGLPPESFFEETPELSDAHWIAMDVSQVASWRRRFLHPRVQRTGGSATP